MLPANDNPEPTKTCTKCGEVKPLSGFPALKRAKDGHRSRCRLCTNADLKLYLDTTPGARDKKRARDIAAYHDPRTHPARLEYHRARYADPEIRSSLLEYERIRRLTDPEFREKKSAVAKAWLEIPENKIRNRASQTAYRNRPERKAVDAVKRKAWNHSPEGRAYFAKRAREVRATASGKITYATRKLLYRTLDAVSAGREGRTFDQLGFTADKLRQRMECQFLPGMSWSNHGEWHIDHKKPIAAFIKAGILDPKIINSLCNLQPLWAHENQAKGAKWQPANDNIAHSEINYAKTKDAKGSG